MKRTLFLSALLAACFSHAYAATYTDLTNAWCDETNNVIYDGKGYFAVKSGSSTSVNLTIDLAALQSYVNSNDYSGYSAMLKWDVDTYDYGIADNADISQTTGSRTAYLSGMNHESKPWNATTNNITYNTLTEYATNGYITLNITNTSGSEGVTIKTTTNAGETVQLYSATGLKYSATATSGYYVNLNYVTEVTLNTESTLDTGAYVPPVDYSEPFVSQRTDGTTVGRVTFLGDSITHGVNDQSYRWQFFKILTDNGIENEIVGPREGYYSTPGHTKDAGSSYGGEAFANVHLAQASGRTHNIISGSNSGMTGVNYGGHSTASTAESFDSNTWICMMGTNDMLSDTPNSGPSTDQYVTQMQKMLGGTVSYDSATDSYTWKSGENWGTMAEIVSDVCQEGDTFYMLSITPWGNHNNHNRDMDHYAALEFNRNLAAWTEAYAEQTGKNVVYVDVTRGMVDPTSSNRFMGHDAFFNSSGDRLHPNDQGSIIMAGNLAQAMGIGGRTAGLTRSDKNTAPHIWNSATVGTDGTVAAGSTLSIAENIFTQDGGYTVDFSANFGDGAANGWSSADNALSISLGDGTNSGTLNLSEGYIMWGSDVLFCWDNSTLAEEGNIRIAWHNGNATDNVLSGYYVWLGDMLIGQGLKANAGGTNGITISATGASGSVTNLTWANAAYAPTTTLITSAENAYQVTQAPGNTQLIVTSGVSYEDSSTTNATNGGILVTSDTSKATYTGILSSANASTTQIKAWVGMVNTAFSDDINVQFTGNIDATIFGAMNNGNGDGAGKLVLDIAAGSIIGTEGTYDNVTAAIAGSYGGGKADAFNVYINGGELGNNVVGGSINGAGSIDSVLIALNSGKITGNIYGGSCNDNGNTSKAGVVAVASSVVGEAQIIINGGEVTGNIVAGGSAGTIGDVEVLITDGTIGGNIEKGTAKRNDGATTNVTVVGNKAKIGGSITADTVTFRDVTASSYSDGFDKYSGTVKADKLTLDNVNVDVLATLDVKAIEVVNGSSTSVILGDTANLATLTLDSDTVFGAFKAAEARTADTASETTISVGTLTAGTGATLNANLKFSADSTLNLAGSLAMGSSVELASGMTLGLSPEMLEKLYSGVSLELFTGVDSLTLDGKTITAGTTLPADDIFSGLSADYTYEMGFNGGVVSLSATMVPEPTTATLSLLALAALAARRRRR